MPNIALYRKYRPRTFAEVFGQEQVTEPLMAALRNDKLNHAYLFSGPRGCGKTSSARILARSVNCAKGPTPEPCGECDSCRALAPDGPGSIDVIEIDAASHGGVDDARELREKAFFAPVNSRYKVYVIDEAHMVSSAGFNALLKLVEEPPEYVLFVFATTEPDKVLGTIKSRTHHYPFRLVPPGVMREHLESICAKEGVTVDPAVFPLVVRAGGGSVRDSQSIMDQLLAGADESGVSYQRAVALLGVTDVELIDNAVDALASSDGGALFGAVDRVVEAGHDPRRFASDLLERLRDLIVLNQVPDAAGTGLLAVPPDEVDRLTAQARRLGPATLSRMADILHEGLTSMRGATSPRLVLEVLCARMLLPAADSTADLLQRLETLERRVAAGPAVPVAPAPAPTAPGPAASVSPPAAPAPAGSGSAAAAPGPAGFGSAVAPAAAGPASAAPAAGPASTAAAPAPAADPAPAAPTSGPASPTAAPPAAEAPVPEGSAPAATSETASSPTPPVPAAAPAPVPAAGAGVDLATIEAHWSAVLAEVKRRRQMVWAILGQNAGPYGLDGDTLILKARNAGTAARLNDDNLASVIQDAVFAVLRQRLRIRCEANPSASGSGPAGRPAPQRSAPLSPPAPPPPPAAADDAGGWPETARPGGSAGRSTESPGAGPSSNGSAPPAGPSPSAAAPADTAPTGSAAPGSAPAGSSPAGSSSTGSGTAGFGASAGGGSGPVASSGRTGGLAPGAPASGGAPGAVVSGGAPGAVATVPRPASPPDWLPDGPTDFSPDDPVPASMGGAAPMPGGAPAAGGAASAVATAPAPTGTGAAGPALDGFAPGDEPTDEPFDPASAPKPVSVEDRAVSLLVQKLGAEPID